VGGSNHVYIVRAISYCQSACVHKLLTHKCHNFCFLFRRHSTGNYHFRIISEHQKQVLDFFLPRNLEKCLSIDNDRRVLLECLLLVIQVVLDLLIDLPRSRPIDDHLVHLVIQQLSGIPNVDCSLYFISREYPHLYSCIFQTLDCVANSVLQLIFYCSRSNQGEVFLHLFCHFVNFLLSSRYRHCCFDVFLAPSFIFIIGNDFLDNEQSSQPIIGIVLQELVGDLSELFVFNSILEQGIQNGVCPFAQTLNHAILVLHDHGHALPSGIELNQIQALVLQLLPSEVYREIVVLIEIDKPSAEEPSCVHQGQLVWR
jgi:hypothetical protein